MTLLVIGIFLLLMSIPDILRPFFMILFGLVLLYQFVYVIRHRKKIDYRHILKWWSSLGLFSIIDIGLTAYILDSGLATINAETNLISKILFNSFGIYGFLVGILINLIVIFIFVSFNSIMFDKNKTGYFIILSLIFLAIINNLVFYIL